MSPKKCKLFGLSGLELQTTYNSLLELKRNITYEESNEDADSKGLAPESFRQQVDAILSLLGSKLEGPQVWLKL